ncbi:DUF2889 domain-containing protein [Janthinobacterium sp. PC23-8]|uniref:DUF2889 domain-containing protein n=1 Tax=Janthinobacterium sp. PC23-8 TaxID=2012679 RepID=UPI001595917D|nr:DUF2889 domain-containing protein [Janthinobacterium sp. PC23-8]
MNSTDHSPERRVLHVRRITCIAYARDDDCIDVEGTLIDTKPYGVRLPERGELQPDEKIHEMTLRLTIDKNMTIRDAVALTTHSPYKICGAIAANYRQLIGIRIEPGFVQRIKRLFRGTAGCSHMTELLPPIATTMFQALWGDSTQFDPDAPGDAGRGLSPLNGCHALRTDGEIVRQYFPNSYRPLDKAPDEA